VKTDRLLSRNFILLWQGQAVSTLGTQAYLVALMLWVTEATGRPALVGTISMIGGLATFLGPLGGTLADRHSRKRLLVWLDLISGTVILLLAGLFFAFPERIALLIVALFVVNIVRETCSSFFLPTTLAFVPDIVAKDRLPAANSLLQSTYQAILFLGQSLGGVLFRILGAPLLFLVDGISFLLSGISETFIRVPDQPREPETTTRESFRRFASETAAGFRFVLTQPGLRIFLILAGIYNFFQASFFVLLPFYVKEILGARVDWYGFLLGGFALGLFAGSVLAGIVRLEGRRRFVGMMICLVLVGVFRGGLALILDPFAAFALLCGAGFTTGFYSIYISSVLQSEIPVQMRGRTFDVIQAFRWGVVPLGMGFFGLLADLGGVSIPTIFLTSGGVIVAISLWAASRRPYQLFLSR